MSDFSTDININDYLYTGPVYYIEPTGSYRSSVILKLVLNSENFNFALTKNDGSDFRLAENPNGSKVMHMWIAKWDSINEQAVLFFKGVKIGGGTSVTFYAFWGNSAASNISDGASVGALFYENFKTSLSSSKWTGTLTNTITSYGYYVGRGVNAHFTSITNPLTDVRSWIVEAGVYANYNHLDSRWTTSLRAIGFGLIGTENSFTAEFCSNNRIKTDVIEAGGGTYSSNVSSQRGIEGYSYQETFLSYIESQDKLYTGLYSRNTFSDYLINWSRKVEGDTRIDNVRILGEEAGYNTSGGYPIYISWLLVREYDSLLRSPLDGRDLYREYSSVPAQPKDNKSYGADITSPSYFHSSNFGGEASNLSIDLYDSLDTVWVSDPEAADESSVELFLGFYGGKDLTSSRYYHYDSGHTLYYNASKLSDNDLDAYGRNYFESTTSSGWVSIKFEGNPKSVGFFSIKAKSSGRPKDFILYGDSVRPTNLYSLGVPIISGTFSDTEDWQYVTINKPSYFRYYTLKVLNTYDDENIRIQEWRMYSQAENHGKRYISQIRLHPTTVGDYMTAFPKMIQFEGSNDLVTWTVLMPWTNTYTPFIQHQVEYGYWQYYSFDNIKGFYNFRLLCSGNWGFSDGTMSIGSWSMHELTEESVTKRILVGGTNNIKQIWASEDSTYDETKFIYLGSDILNIVHNDELARTESIDPTYTDINV